MSEDDKIAVTPEQLVEAVRAESAALRLVSKPELESRFPDTDISATLASGEAVEDLMYLDGTQTVYYFSTRSLSVSYATHLARLAENNPARLIAETVRDESKVYGRTTSISTFADAPFSLPAVQVEEILTGLRSTAEFADICSCTASNGAIFLYSSKYLDQGYAESLTEWNEVGRQMNP